MWSWFPNLISLFLRRRAPRSGSKQFASAAPAHRGPAQSMACATSAAKAARLRIQEARSASEPSPATSRTTAPMRGQQLRCASAGRRVRHSYNSSRLPGFRAGTDRSRSRSSGRAWHGASRSRSAPHLPEVPKNLDRSSICKMGAVRKTGIDGTRRSAGGSERSATFAADRVAHISVGPESDGQRLDNFLLRIAKGVPKSHVYRVVRSGEVRVNKGRVAADYRLRRRRRGAGARRCGWPRRVRRAAPFAPADMPPVLYEDEHLLVVDKPAGLAAHGGSGIAHGMIERVRAARPHQPFLELAHRLDRETSGLLLLAKTRRALSRPARATARGHGRQALSRAGQGRLGQRSAARAAGADQVRDARRRAPRQRRSRGRGVAHDLHADDSATAGSRCWRRNCGPDARIRSACTLRTSAFPSSATTSTATSNLNKAPGARGCAAAARRACSCMRGRSGSPIRSADSRCCSSAPLPRGMLDVPERTRCRAGLT